MQDFLQMGGYGAFVWPCFALAVAILGGFAAVSVARLKARQRELDALKTERDRAA
jgi:heme exporter protein CcmD